MRKIKFDNNHFYHIYNRGVDKRDIYLEKQDYIKFIKAIRLLLDTGSTTPKVTQSQQIRHRQSLAFHGKLSFISYCLMPNHYHLIVRQLTDNAIVDFMHKIGTSYTKYFNKKNRRTGRLFEGTFKSIEVISDAHLKQLSQYIHLNPLIANLVTNLNDYPWSSYLDYVGSRQGTLCEKQALLDLFSSPADYKNFVLNQVEYARKMKTIKHLVIEKAP